MLPASLRPRLSTMSAPSPALVRGSVGRLRPPLSESAAIQGGVRNSLSNCLVRRFPYVVYFHDREELIYILAVAHGRRRTGYWRNRV